MSSLVVQAVEAGGVPAGVLVERAKAIIANTTAFDELLEIRDKAEAIRQYSARRGDAIDVVNAYAEIKLWDERRLGELLQEMQPKSGRPKSFHDERISLKDVGVSHTQSHRWQKIASIDDDEFERYIEQTKAAGKELTTAGAYKIAACQSTEHPVAECDPECGGDVVRTLGELVEAGRRYRTIYADPPWQYGNQATRASTGNHYGTMTVDEICAEPVREIVEDDAHLHLWTTNAFLFDARRVMEAWGFEYKSCYVWVKPQMGIGNYWRVSHEFLLFGIRGRMPFRARDEMSWGQFDRTAHSAKPDAVRSLIEKVSPGPYLEMYGRKEILASAWTVYGNQVGRMMF